MGTIWVTGCCYSLYLSVWSLSKGPDNQHSSASRVSPPSPCSSSSSGERKSARERLRWGKQWKCQIYLEQNLMNVLTLLMPSKKKRNWNDISDIVWYRISCIMNVVNVTGWTALTHPWSSKSDMVTLEINHEWKKQTLLYICAAAWAHNMKCLMLFCK